MTSEMLRRQELWLRCAFVIIMLGTAYLVVQGADLYALQAVAAAAGPTALPAGAGVEPVAYVPVAKDTQTQLYAGGAPPADAKVAEVGDGGDLGRRAAKMLASKRPYLFAQAKDDVAYVALGPALDYLGGELKWTDGAPQATVILADALITFTPGQTSALRNYREIALPAPPLAEYGQIRLPVKTLEDLCGLKVEAGEQGNIFKLSRGERVLHVIVREHMYSMEVSRSGRWLQVFFLGQPIKRYPLCTGRGNNTPVGSFHIQNKAVWPPWNAYWGEYMPGGSARNPLGARWLGTSARGHEEGRAIGIHGTNQPSSIGKRISGGCMRTYNDNAIELFNNIPVGTPVTIHE